MTVFETDPAALERVARRLGGGPFPPPTAFVYAPETPWYPPLNAAWAVPFFFSTTLHLYGLWEEDNRRFLGPVRGRIDGREFAGDDFLWKASWRAVQEEPDYLRPGYQAALTADTWTRLFRDDAGRCPVPLAGSHAELARALGSAWDGLKSTPHKILEECRNAPRPLERFLLRVADLPGYREDRLQRKSFLLALILSSRPERFLPAPGADWPPVLDRHMIRLALRWGTVRVRDAGVAALLRDGIVVPPPVEEAARLSAYEVFAGILRRSGRTVPETYGLFAAARDYCPETAAPDCADCFFRDVCAKDTGLRQPVVRTMSY